MDSSLYKRILSILCNILDADTVALYFPIMPESAESPHELVAVFSAGSGAESLMPQLRAGDGLAGWIIRNKQPLLVPNLEQRRSRLGYYKDNADRNIKSFMGCSLPEDSGIICIDSGRQYAFSEKDQEMLALFGEFLKSLYEMNRAETLQADALRYYTALRLIYVLRREHSRWTEFLLGFLDIVSKASNYEYCALCTLQPDGNSFSIEGENYDLLLSKQEQGNTYPLSSGMVGWVFRNAAPLCSGGISSMPDAPLLGRYDHAAHLRSMIAMPLIIQRKVRGVLCLGSEYALDTGQEVQEFARMASEHLALYLENLFIKCRLRDFHKSLMSQK